MLLIMPFFLNEQSVKVKCQISWEWKKFITKICFIRQSFKKYCRQIHDFKSHRFFYDMFDNWCFSILLQNCQNFPFEWRLSTFPSLQSISRISLKLPNLRCHSVTIKTTCIILFHLTYSERKSCWNVTKSTNIFSMIVWKFYFQY